MRTSWEIVLLAFLLVLGSLATASALTIGMVADNTTQSVTVFDADTGTILGTVFFPIAGATGDCSVTADQTRGFVTRFNGEVWVIDLTTSPPSLAPGPNPIPISNLGEDTVITPDNKFLVTCDGSVSAAVSVIDIATQTEIGTFFLGHDCNSVDICGDNSVIVTSSNTGNVRRLTISPTGVLADTGEVMPSGGEPNNAYCAPGSASGVVLTRSAHQIRSFTIPGLVPVDTRPLAGAFSGISGLFNAAGDRVYARSNTGSSSFSPGFVEVFDYNAATGALGAAPILTIPIAGTPTFFGMDQMALHPDGSKLYVSQPSAVNVYNAATGAPLPPITDPNIVGPTGVSLRSGPSVVVVDIDIKPGSFPNSINPRSQGVIPVAILTTATFDATTVDPTTVRFGATGTEAAPLQFALEDVDGDGDIDLILHFSTQATGIQCGSASASLTGETFGGQMIQGSDSISTVGCK